MSSCSQLVSNRISVEQLIRDIQSLTEAENNLEGRRKSIHADELALVFSIGYKIEQLKAIVPFGQYKVELAKSGLSWTSANRKHSTYLLFGQYRHEPWINNFGKSALQELAYYHFQKSNNRAVGLVDKAIALAQGGTEIGVAWVQSQIEGRRHEAGERKTRLSARVRKAVHAAIEQHGEEKLLVAIAELGGIQE